jgi:hypothetical protein
MCLTSLDNKAVHSLGPNAMIAYGRTGAAMFSRRPVPAKTDRCDGLAFIFGIFGDTLPPARPVVARTYEAHRDNPEAKQTTAQRSVIRTDRCAWCSRSTRSSSVFVG